MLDGFFLYDADTHVSFDLVHHESLPDELRWHRPRLVEIPDGEDLDIGSSAYAWEGRLFPSPIGAGSHPAHPGWHKRVALATEADAASGARGVERAEAASVGDAFITWPWAAQSLSDPLARVRVNERYGIDRAVLVPSTVYATLTENAELLAAYYRSYNRYIGRQTGADRDHLRWVGLLPLQHQDEAFAAIEEMLALGASAALVYGTAGDRFLSDSAFVPILRELERVDLPLAIHAGGSYTPFQRYIDTLYKAITLGLAYPALLAFNALVAGGVLDRHPKLRVGFLEFGADWLLHVVERGDKYRELYRDIDIRQVPAQAVVDYTRSDRFYISGEPDDRFLLAELELVTDDGFMFSSDLPHGEGREDAAVTIIKRQDLDDEQKTKILGTNASRFYREP